MMSITYLVIVCILMKYFLILIGYLACAIITTHKSRKYYYSGVLQNPKNGYAEKLVPNLLSNRWRGGRSAVDGTTKYLLEKTSMIPSHFIRKRIYTHIFKLSLSKKVVIYKGTVFREPYKISIGEGSIVGDDNILDGRSGLTIGKNVNLSSEVRIWTGQHAVQGKQFEFVGAPVSIGDRCWISGGVTILPGVSIGEGAVIASGAVVTKDVEPFAIYAGIPAKKIGVRTKELKYEFPGTHDYFF